MAVVGLVLGYDDQVRLARELIDSLNGSWGGVSGVRKVLVVYSAGSCEPWVDEDAEGARKRSVGVVARSKRRREDE